MPINTITDMLFWVNQYTGQLDCSNISRSKTVLANLRDLSPQLNKYQKSQMSSWMKPDYSFPYITLWNKDFPTNISHLSNAPTMLFYLGDIGLLKNPTIAIVGTRRPHQHSIQIARNIARNQSRMVSIIGGCSSGIEFEAQQTILHRENSASSIGIFEQPLHTVSGVRKRWMDTIVKNGGLVISEFGPNHTYRKWQYAQRNRLLAALSDCIIIVEASKKSGSISIGQYGLEFGKNVFSIPHHPKDSTGAGCNQLIIDGAKPIYDHQDIAPTSFEDDFIKSLNTPLSLEEIASAREETIIQTTENGSVCKTGHLWMRT